MEGNTEEALTCLRKALDAGGIFVLWRVGQRDLLTETLSDNPDFEQLMEDLKSEREEIRQKVEKVAQEWEQK